MGFYINVTAKKGCSRQINSLWKKLFNDFLIYTPSKIKKEIDALHQNPIFSHLSYVKTVDSWGKTFPIYALGRGQIFIRAFGYSLERAEEFKANNEVIKSKIQFVLDNRMLFSSVTGLTDAVDTFGMDIKGEYIENGKMKNHEKPNFAKLPQKNKNPIYISCLKMDRPEIWEHFLDISDNGFNDDNWSSIRGYLVGGDTIWQRCEKMAEARDGVNYGLMGRYNKKNFPSDFDLAKAITFDQEKFNKALLRLRTPVEKEDNVFDLFN